MFLKTCNFIKKRLKHRCFPAKFAKLLGTSFFIEHLRWLLLSFLQRKRIKWKKKWNIKWNKINIKWKNVITWAYSLESTSDGVLFSTVAALTAYNFMKKGLHIRCFLWILWSFTESFFTEDSWTTASDFQQHFGHTTCSISNKSTLSQLNVCLGSLQSAVPKQFTVFVSKIFKITKVEGNVYSGWGRCNKQKKGI